jgi:peroxiredoxin Q/BCP
MSTPEAQSSVPEFELQNVGVGPDPLSLAEVASVSDFAVLLFLRDYHCPRCKAQVENLAAEAERFNERNAAVLPILPEPQARAESWKNEFDWAFPFPLLADGSKTVADKYDQPTQYGALGSLHDMIGRLPQSIVLDTRGDDTEVIFSHRGDSAGDRPEADDLLDAVESVRESFVFDCSLVDC